MSETTSVLCSHILHISLNLSTPPDPSGERALAFWLHPVHGENERKKKKKKLKELLGAHQMQDG